MEKKNGEKDTITFSGNTVVDRKQRLVDLLLISLDGRTKDTVKSDNEFMLDGIKGVALPTYKGAGKFGRKDETRPFALSVCQALVQMLDFGGFELREIVDCNVDLVAYLAERRDAGAVLEAELIELEAIMDLHLDEPRRKEDFEDKLEIRLGKEKQIWDAAKRTITSARIDRKLRSHTEDNEASKVGIADDDVSGVKDWEELKSELRLELLGDYGNMVDEFRTHANAVRVAGKKKSKLLEVRSKEVLLSTKLKGYQSAISSIVNRIKGVIGDCPEVKRTISMRVTIGTTGEEVSDPWYVGNLCGMKQLLMTAYNKASLVTFNHTMLSTISYKADVHTSTNEPIKVVQAVSTMLNTWEMMGYYTFMTKDVFFTAILINSLAEGSPVKEKVLLRANERMSEIDGKDGTDTDDMSTSKTSDTPLFTYISNYVKVLQDSMVRTGTGTAAGQGNGNGGGNGGGNNARKVWDQRVPKGTESAALAQGEGDKADNQTGKAATLFKYNVNRDHKVQGKDKKGRTVPYTSTREACSVCTNPDKASHDPQCLMHMCYTCGLYGHHSRGCRQDPKTHMVRKAALVTMDYGALADEADEEEDC